MIVADRLASLGELAAKAQDGTISMDDLTGGTIGEAIMANWLEWFPEKMAEVSLPVDGGDETYTNPVGETPIHMGDPFVIQHDGDELPLITRSSDGQMLFLANMCSKMKHNTPLGSRIAEVHNGSSLFTGDAGQGESNIRRWIIENDWLEAIVALPTDMFYNTGIATYVWMLSNTKATERKGRVSSASADPKATRPARASRAPRRTNWTSGSVMIFFIRDVRGRRRRADTLGYFPTPG